MIVRATQGARRRHRLHHPPPGRDLRSPTASPCCATARSSATRQVADTNGDELVQMMVGRRIDELFPKASRRVGAPVLEVKDLVRRPMVRRREPRPCAPARLSASLASSARGAASWRRRSSASRRPTSGEHPRSIGESVRIDTPPRARVQRGIAYVPEDRGEQGLVRPMASHTISRSPRSARCRAWASSTGGESGAGRRSRQALRITTSRSQQIVGQLSGGNQQKVVLGKWLATNPQAAHPRRTDARHRRRRQGRDPPPDERARAAQGMAILMISSELPEVLGMSDRMLVMRAGRLVAEFDRAARDLGGGRRRNDGRSGGGRGAWRRERDGDCQARRERAAGACGASPRRSALLAAAVIGLALVVGFINPRFLAARNLSRPSFSATPISRSPRSACRW